jgi:protein arginine N-methyltransferase 1
MRIEYHRTLIADRVRTTAFRDALAELIVPGQTTVADIGTGTGLLAFLAARLGARKVYAYEMAEIGAVAERLKALNKLRNVELVPGRSIEFIDPPRVDLVVSETLGNYAFEESLVATMNDARARYLKPGGVLVPRAVEQLMCPVVTARHRDELCAWDRVGRDLDIALDLGPARNMSLNNAYVRKFDAGDLLDGGAAAQTWDRVDLALRNRHSRKGAGTWKVARATTVHGVAVWWVATLSPRVALSTSPLAPPTHWEQLFLPALEPLVLARGDTLAAEIASRTSESGGTDLAWSLAVLDAQGRERQRQSMSLAKGFLP